MSRHLERAQLLLQQDRHREARDELLQALSTDPNNPLAHLLLAICIAEADDYPEALAHVEKAIALAPDLCYAYYVQGQILLDADKLTRALHAAREAIRLNPTQPDYFGLLANILVGRKDWEDALEAAETGLRFDPSHLVCLNLRAISLRGLGRTDESGLTLDAALAEQPNNSMSHANKGWTMLHQGESNAASEHFREALRLDPESEYARIGFIESLKAKHFLYALMLRYFLWVAQLKTRAQWALIIGVVLGMNILNNIAGKNPTLAPIIDVILMAYILFVMSTWLANPLFNLVLRFHPDGRYALSSQQIRTSNWLALGLLFAIISASYLIFVAGEFSFWPMILPFFLLFPVVTACKAKPPWPQRVMTCYALGTFALFLLAILHSVEQFLLPYVWSCVLATWVANIIPRGAGDSF